MRTRCALLTFLMLAFLTLAGLDHGGLAYAQRLGERSDSPTPADQPRLVVQSGHTGWVNVVRFIPGDQFVLTANSDGTACLWEVATGLEVRRFIGHEEGIEAAVVSKDGKLLLTGSDDKTARLWDVATGREIRRFTGHEFGVHGVALSPDSRYILTASGNNAVSAMSVFESKKAEERGLPGNTARLFDLSTGQEVRRFDGDSTWVRRVAFSPDGRFVFTSSSGGFTRMFEMASGKEIWRAKGAIDGPIYSLDGRLVIVGRDNRILLLWDAATGQELRRFEGIANKGWSPWESGIGKLIVSDDEKDARLWDIDTGREINRLSGHTDYVLSAALAADGRTVLTGSMDQTAKLWDVATGKEVQRFESRTDKVSQVAFASDGRSILRISGDGSVRLWNMETGQEVHRFDKKSDYVWSFVTSPNGRLLATVGWSRAHLYDVASGRELHQFGRDPNPQYWSVSHSGPQLVALSPDTTLIVACLTTDTVYVWNATTGQKVRNIQPEHQESMGLVRGVAISPDSQFILIANNDNTSLYELASGKRVRRYNLRSAECMAFAPDGRTLLLGGFFNGDVHLLDAATGQEIRRFHAEARSLAYSPDGRFALINSGNAVSLVDVNNGQEVRRFTASSATVSAAFSPDGRFVLTGNNNVAHLWSAATGRQLCSITFFKDGTWAVIDAEGRYDAANLGEVEGLHWVVGNEPIELAQLKDRFYEPGLLSKIIGVDKAPLRDVRSLGTVKLFPKVDYQPPAPNSTAIKITLTNRGGGVGKVRVLVNGKEVTALARGASLNPKAAKTELMVDLAGAAIKPGEPNRIEVRAWNAEGYLSSRGVALNWTPKGKTDVRVPEVYAIVGGVSAYSSEAINLRYAAKDAEDIGQALRLGAKRLFGVDKVHLTVLSTSGNAGTIAPTKENFKRAFDQARQAKPEDILVVYLSGHGVAIRLAGDNDTYCYLTRDARSTDLSDPALRAQWAITSDELVEWIKQIKALKQVMMLDTCAAGAVETKLTVGRNLSSDQIRAIDRLKDRTGFHVLMGAAADRVSYEATQFSQGLLTYALLEGMKGAALLKDEFVDVSKLFQYAADRVPELSRMSQLGGIQKPVIATPKGGSSFEIGQLNREDKEAIPLAKGRPLLLRPVFLNSEGFDELDLTGAVRRKFDEASFTSAKGEVKIPALVYVDADDLPGALKASGTYRIAGEAVSVVVNLVRDRQRVSAFEVQGQKSDLAALAAQMVARIEKAVNELR